MTFDRLYYLVRMLANNCHCRYWKMYDYPNNTEFAIQCLDYNLTSYLTEKYIPELEKESGFLRIDHEGIYVFRKDASQ